MNDDYVTKPFPPIRRATIDLLKAAKRKNMIHGLLEVDITKARADIRKLKATTRSSVSVTAFIIYCVAKAVVANRRVQAYRNWRNQLILFNDVDVSTTVERTVKGNSEVVPKIIRAANRKTIREIAQELKSGKAEQLNRSQGYRSVKLYLAIPAFLRRLVFRLLDRFPHFMKRKAGTVMVTSVGMMLGGGAGWGIPIASHTLNVTVGGIVDRPVLVDGKLANREHICLTMSVDHDIVDGAPAARFVRELKVLIAKGIPLS